ncbi:MAG: hypothetical protein A2666_01815 [Parcubacteria group bacterium RIFCSPHIGHO2_01_FULL_47_10b]|nr:MAG: hypothetical protein A2666_01815 [Parcubacteria group bacterium RIFCSPHIGHO2_01_FULL_47_10b]
MDSASLISGLFTYIVIIFSAVVHEYAHAWTANYLGDPTARLEGRLTLNPLRHLDPLGTVLIPLVLVLTSNIFIGWAKPVPFNPYNLRDQKNGILKVAIAGPLSNFAIAIVLGLGLRFGLLTTNAEFSVLIAYVVQINLYLALFNLIPAPPLDGSKVFYQFFPRAIESIGRSGLGIFLALAIAFFVLAPIAQALFTLIVGA